MRGLSKSPDHQISIINPGCIIDITNFHWFTILQAILEKKTDEERKLCIRVEDLELQLNKEKEDCQRSYISN